MKKINQEIFKLLEPVFKKKGRILYQLIKSWPQIVGDKLAFSTIPSKISLSKNLTTLHILCSSHGVSTELFYQEQIILEKIFIFLGSDIIKRLKIYTNPSGLNLEDLDKQPKKNKYLVPETISLMIQSIEDQELAETLQSFSQIFQPESK